MTKPDVLLTAQAVSKSFGEQRALDGVHLTIGRGEVHALVGENGSGKSTLIKILAGYYTPDPDSGCLIKVAGQELPAGSQAGSHRLGLRFVHQHLGLVAELNAPDNMGLTAGFATRRATRPATRRATRWARIDAREQRDRTRKLLARIGVTVDLDAPVGELRPVERSSIAIARALDDRDGEIALLVLDEPTAALPPAEVDALFRVVRDVAARGVSVLYVSHRLDEVLALADVVSVLRDGRHQGTFPADELTRERIVEHILGGAASAAAPARAPADVRAGVRAAAPALRVRHLSARYLNDLTFEVCKGEILGVAGLDGSGRDELAGALAGATPARGTVTDARGAELAKLTPRHARRHKIALVLPNWHPASAVREFDVRENVSLATLGSFARLGTISRKREQQAALDWLSTVDVRPRDPAKRYGLLSGGNQQKVIVARWLATRPDTLILDDPTSGVDIGARQQIYGLIRAQQASGAGVLLCSSDTEDLTALCDRVLCLVNGRITAELERPDITEPALLAAISATASAGDAP